MKRLPLNQSLIACTILLLACILLPVNSHALGPGNAGWDEFQTGDYLAAHRIWLPLAEQGDGDAALGLAILYENGLGVVRDNVQAVHWYQMAAIEEIPEAEHDLGIKYFTGDGVTKDYKQAYKLWKSAAESGLGSAQAKLAYLYTQGLGVQRNYDEAVRWYRQAVKQNNGEAMYNLSLLYQNGTGVRQDRHQFLHWLRQAAAYNHSRAQYDLGLMLMHGMEMERSVSEGKRWLIKASDSGLADAQYYLGTLYLNGHILAPNRDEAIKLFQAAANQGHAPAKQTLFDLKQLADTGSQGIKLGKTVAKTTPKTTAKPPLPPLEPEPDPAEEIKEPAEVVAQGTLQQSDVTTSAREETIQTTSNSGSGVNRTDWLLQQPSDQYTIQILATQDKKAALKYINQLKDIDAFIYSFRKQNSNWYAVVTGIYQDYGTAGQAANQLPKSVIRGKPWVRNLGIIQGIIRKSG